MLKVYHVFYKMLSLKEKYKYLPGKKVIINMFASFLIEFTPILLFIFSYSYLHIYKATFLLMIAVIISTYISYIKEKRIPYIGLYISFLTLIFGYITIAYHIPKFIQIRDSIYDLTFAATLIIGLVFNKVFLYQALNKTIPMARSAWIKITYSWITFFILNAITNEVIRRNFDVNTWIHYKMSVVFISIIFGLVTGVIFYNKEDGDNKHN